MIKQIIKKIIARTWQWFYLKGAFPSLNNKAVIFMLHRMSSPDVIEQGHSPKFLDQALSYLKNKGYNFVSLEQLFDAAEGKIELPARSIAFTIDDGFEDQAEIAAPIFIKHQCPVTIFLITNFIDTGSPPWDSFVKHVFINADMDEIKLKVEGEQYRFNLSNLDERYNSLREFRDKCKECSQDHLINILTELLSASGMKNVSLPLSSARPLTWKRARELEEQGVSFAPHTETHIILSKASDDLASKEITGAWDRVNAELKHPCPVFAYPTGRKQDFTRRDINVIRELNLKGAVTAEAGYFKLDEMTEADRYLVKRMSFPSNLEDLIQSLSGLELVKSELTKFKCNIQHHGRKYMLSVVIIQFKSFLGFYNHYRRLDWDKISRLVFVCKGNICRSPYAEMKVRSLGLDAISGGLSTLEGSPANASAIKSASYRKIGLEKHRANLLKSITINETDLIVCMEPHQLSQFSKANSIDCQSTLLGLWGHRKKPVIIDPYGKADSFFDDCFEEIDAALYKLTINAYIQKKRN